MNPTANLTVGHERIFKSLLFFFYYYRSTFLFNKKTTFLGVVSQSTMVTRTGFEPMNACVKGMCVQPLHQRATKKQNGGPEWT